MVLMKIKYYVGINIQKRSELLPIRRKRYLPRAYNNQNFQYQLIIEEDQGFVEAPREILPRVIFSSSFS